MLYLYFAANTGTAYSAASQFYVMTVFSGLISVLSGYAINKQVELEIAMENAENHNGESGLDNQDD